MPRVVALRDVDLAVEAGEFLAIVGPSGGGKSTLLNVLGLLDEPTSGEYLLDGAPVPRGQRAAASLRAGKFAFVFQSFHLLERRPVIDSVELGLLYRGVDRRQRLTTAREALAQVGLADRARQDTSLLSGGERQRVAIARAVAAVAPIVLADEPTGSLDTANGRRIIAELRRLNARGATVIVVTHSEEVAHAADRCVQMVDGRLSEAPRRTASSVAPVAVIRTPGGSPPEPSPEQSITGVRLPDTALTPSQHGTPSPPERRRAIGLLDVLRDAVASVRSRRLQSIALSLAVSLAVGLAVTTVGLSTSVRSQVSAAFDARLNREVTLAWDTGSDGLPDAPAHDAVETRLAQVNGLQSVGVVTDHPQVTVAGTATARVVQPHTATADYQGAGGISVRWSPTRGDGPLQDDEVLLGAILAGQLEAGPLEATPIVTVAEQPYRVAGLITDSTRLPLLTGELLLTQHAADTLGEPTQATALILTQPGAAPQVAAQAPTALHPEQPDLIRVSAPTDSTSLRLDVESGLQTAMVAFTALALLVAVAALMNAMLMAVTARRAEIGMRKALGALPRHIAFLIATESTVIGIVGGIVGLVLAVAAILTITIANRWTPVFDLQLGPLAVLAGLAVGALAGTLAALRAARLRSAEALRQ